MPCFMLFILGIIGSSRLLAYLFENCKAMGMRTTKNYVLEIRSFCTGKLVTATNSAIVKRGN